MKKYMVVTLIDGSQHAAFFDQMEQVREYFSVACGAMGGDAEVYEYKEATEDECGGYEFLYS